MSRLGDFTIKASLDYVEDSEKKKTEKVISVRVSVTIKIFYINLPHTSSLLFL